MTETAMYRHPNGVRLNIRQTGGMTKKEQPTVLPFVSREHSSVLQRILSRLSDARIMELMGVSSIRALAQKLDDSEFDMAFAA